MVSIGYRQGEKPLFEYLRHHTQVQPEHTAFVWYGREVSFRELNTLSDNFAAVLWSLGIRKGDRVALFLQNSPQYVIAHIGIQKIGAIVGPCSPLFKAQELQYQLADLGARVIVADEHLYSLVQAVRADTALEHVFVTNYADMLPESPSMALPEPLQQEKLNIPDTTDLLDCLRQDRIPPAVSWEIDDVSLITYTSGTTGLPKGVMLTHRNALYKSFSVADHNPVRADDIQLCVAPVYHIAGMLVGINMTLYAGITTVLLFRFDPINAMQAVDQYKVSWWYGASTVLAAVMAHPDVKEYDFSSLRLNPSTSFGVSVTAELASRWNEIAPNTTVFEVTYGLSETHTWDTTMPVDAIRWGTHGKPVTGVEMRIVDPDTGQEKPAGDAGELLIRSPGNFSGYWNKPEATSKTLQDGWVHTGDIAKLDGDGYMTFIGRYKELIKVSGYSVSPEEVEIMLVQHPYVRQVAVVGVDDPVKGQVVKAFVIPDKTESPASEEEIIAWCKQNMSAYKVPKHIVFCEKFPTTGLGKVLRRLLKDEN